MKAMILAAGRGERMRPLTDQLPKPLLRVGGKPLIVWQIQRLLLAGISDIVINHAWLGDKIEASLGDGSDVVFDWSLSNPFKRALRITYSPETKALETAGGIANALPLLGSHGETSGSTSCNMFAVINGDVWCDFPLTRLHSIALQMQANHALCHCVLVKNPEHHPEGDFLLSAGTIGTKALGSKNSFTFSGIGVYAPALFTTVQPGQAQRLAPLIQQASAAGRASGEIYNGSWQDIGTVERLQQLDKSLQQPQLHQQGEL